MEVVGQIESLAFGGEGILRHEGLVIFVPFTAPGDRVRIKVTQRKKNFAEGELVELLTPGQERCAPRCCHFGECGGCQLQHLQAQAQVKQKEKFILDAFARIGKITELKEIPVMPSPVPWGYRRHVRLTLVPEENGYRAGYVRHDLKGVLSIRECPIFLAEGEHFFSKLQAFLGKLTPVSNTSAHLSLVKQSEGRYLLFFQFSQQSPPHLAAQIEKWRAEEPSLTGVVVQTGTALACYGETEGKFEVEGLHLSFSPRAFVQCHPEQSAAIYREVLRIAAHCEKGIALDLYSGIGATALLLAREGWQVTAVEGNAEAVKLALKNADANQINTARFLQADVGKFVKNILKYRPQLVIINPPRTGLEAKVRSSLLEAKASNLVYISCMPATLARDLAAFREGGFQIVHALGFDMFPQTSHVETVVWLTPLR